MKEENKSTKGFIPVHGGYRNLFSYQKAEIIYDGTAYLPIVSYTNTTAP